MLGQVSIDGQSLIECTVKIIQNLFRSLQTCFKGGGKIRTEKIISRMHTAQFEKGGFVLRNCRLGINSQLNW
jgi:hypothetical protein